LALKQAVAWYWVGNTTVNSVAIGDVDGDGYVEIVTGGWYYSGADKIAQLVVWNGATLASKSVKVWSWTGDTCINSVAAGDVDGDGSAEIVTGGYYYDGTRDVAQLAVWNGSTLALKQAVAWYWVGNTTVNSVAIGDVDGDGYVEIVTGGCYNDGTHNHAQLIVWEGSDLTSETVTTWQWIGNTYINSVATGDVDGDGIIEILTGGSYHDGTRTVAQLTVWIITSS
jgi:hypothetical protein